MSTAGDRYVLTVNDSGSIAPYQVCATQRGVAKLLVFSFRGQAAPGRCVLARAWVPGCLRACG